MINAIVNFILKFFIWLANLVIGLISLPIAALLSALFPNFNNYTNQVLQFFNDYIIVGLRFAKEVFLNVTHFPRPLLGIAVTFAVGLFAYFLATQSFRGVINVWKFIKGGK